VKKRLILTFLFLIAVLTACSSGPDYKVAITKPLYYQKETAMPVEIKVTENKKAVTGLDISAELSMANMDHGTYNLKLTEGKNGTYSGKVKLPMAGKYELAFTVVKDGHKTEKVIDYVVKKPKGVAAINGNWITGEDLAFYQLANKLQLAINRETAQKKYSGKQLKEELSYLDSQEKTANDKNQLLTQIIRIRAMALIAEEKGHKATAEDIQTAMKKDNDQYQQSASAKSIIQAYGEEKFRKAEELQYKYIFLSKQVLSDLAAQAKKENPNVGVQEINYLAQQKYEDLLVTQVNSLKIEIL
jgi:methionine-rich copper-binding protein CopC